MAYGEEAYGGLAYGEAEGPLFIPALHRLASIVALFPPINEIQGRIVRRPGWGPPWAEFAQTYEQGYRIADDALALFELFVGIDQSPDFSATGQPVATSATLPFSWTPTPLPATGATTTFHLVVRKRNAYDLQSFNVYERFVVIDSAGSEVLGPITPPLAVAVYDVAAGELRVLAKYINSEDADPADTWEIYIKEGSNPVPGTDVPAFSGAMVFVGYESQVNQVMTGFTPGAVAHVIVTALRASDSGRGNAAAVLFTIALPLDITDGFLFGGSTYEQR